MQEGHFTATPQDCINEFLEATSFFFKFRTGPAASAVLPVWCCQISVLGLKLRNNTRLQDLTGFVQTTTYFSSNVALISKVI